MRRRRLRVLLHYGGTDPETGIATLPGELFGQRLEVTDTAVSLRATLALADRDFQRVVSRLDAAITTLTSPLGPGAARRALHRAIDAILAHTHY